MHTKWNWLAGTYWYVPPEYLRAARINSTQSPPVWMNDQTVWHITGSEDGYLWGDTAVQLFKGPQPQSESVDALRQSGSVTPDGSVYMAFIITANKPSAPTLGFGRMIEKGDAWVFGEMQMSSGSDAMKSW